MYESLGMSRLLFLVHALGLYGMRASGERRKIMGPGAPPIKLFEIGWFIICALTHTRRPNHPHTHPGPVRVVHRAVAADNELRESRLELQLLVEALPALGAAIALVGLLLAGFEWLENERLYKHKWESMRTSARTSLAGGRKASMYLL